MDCIFCKIVAGEIPANKVYEDDKTLAFLDINPVNPGHVLIIPKEHYENLDTTPEALACHMMAVVKKIATASTKAVGANAWNLGVNVGKIAGQVVFHTHFHVMPRFSEDGHKLWHGKPYKEGEAEDLVKKIKENL